MSRHYVCVCRGVGAGGSGWRHNCYLKMACWGRVSTQTWEGDGPTPPAGEEVQLPSNPAATHPPLPMGLILWPLVLVHSSSNPPKITHSPNSISKLCGSPEDPRGRERRSFISHITANCLKSSWKKSSNSVLKKNLFSPQIFVATLPPKGAGSQGGSTPGTFLSKTHPYPAPSCQPAL